MTIRPGRGPLGRVRLLVPDLGPPRELLAAIVIHGPGTAIAFWRVRPTLSANRDRASRRLQGGQRGRRGARCQERRLRGRSRADRRRGTECRRALRA
jgi:hypothetical protein